MTAPSTSLPPSPGSTRRRFAVLGIAAVAVLAALAVVYTLLSPSTADGPTGADVGPYTATTLAGQQVTVPGGKPSAVLFFSASCGSCGTAAQALAQAQNADPQAANYVVVDLDPNETPEDIRGFLTDNQATTLAVADDTGARLSAAYRVTQLTTLVILGPDGQVDSTVVEPSLAQIQSGLAQADSR